MSREPAASRQSAAFFAATLALLAALRVRPAVHLDTARDLLLARDCVLAGRCGAGPRASFGEWTQGALWSHLLELRELLGLGLVALEHAAIVGVALAAALVPFVARALDRRATALTWSLWLPATLLTIGWPTLWNPTPWPLVLAAFHLALLHAARTRGLLAFTAAAAALALAIDVHVASAVLVPCLAAALVARAARPLPTACLAAVVAIAALALDSPAAFADNRELVARHAFAIGLVLAIAAALGLALRRRLAADDSPARTVALALCAYLIITLPLLAFVAGHPLHARYLAPLVTPLAIVLGQRGARWPAVLACAAYLALWLDDRRYNHRFRLHETEPIAAALYGRGLGFGDLYQHLRGPHAYDLLSTLAALEPVDHRGAADDLDLLVFRTDRDALPADLPREWTVVDLGAHVAVIVAYAPRIVTDRFTVCATDSQCTAITLDRARFVGAPWADRAHAAIPGLARPARGDRLTYRFRVRPGEPRRIRLFADECKGWRITDHDVLASRGSGELEITLEATPRCRGWLPPFVELPLTAALD